MPSVSSTVSANYLKAASNFSNFGTRQLVFINVDVADIETNPSDSNSVFARATRAIQQIDLSKRTPEVAIGYLDSKYRDIAWRYIRILGFERTISFMASNNFHPE